MEFRDYKQTLREAWLFILTLAVVGATLGAMASLLTTPTYTSTAKAYVSPASAPTVSDLGPGAAFAATVAQDLAQVATTPYLLDPIVEKYRLRTTSAALARDINVSAGAESTILEIDVTYPDSIAAANIANELVEQLSAKVDELSPATTGQVASVKVTQLQAAVPSARSSNTGLPTFLFLGGLLGAAAAVVLVVVRDALASRVRTVRDLTRIMTATTVVTGADLASPLSRSVAEPKPTPELFRSASAVALLRPTEKRTLVVSSSTDGECRARATQGLARALASSGRSVVVLDMDTHQDVSARLFDLPASLAPDQSGLSEVFRGAARLEDVMHAAGDGVNYIASGRDLAFALDNVRSRSFDAVITALGRQFDFVLIQAPAVLASSDAAFLGAYSDALILVCEIGRDRRREVARTIETLSMMRVQVLFAIALEPSAQTSKPGTRSEHRPLAQLGPLSRPAPAPAPES